MTMSRGEREDLLRIVKQRERVQKMAAEQRSAELLADFEKQLGSIYSYNQDEVWSKVAEEAKAVIKRGKSEIAARCAELGIPKEFAPDIEFQW